MIPFVLALIAFGFVHAAEAQQPKKTPRIAVLAPGSVETFQTRIDAFRRGLRDLGYVEGENILIEYRYGNGKQDLINEQAIELVRLKFDVIVTSPTPAVRAVKNASSTIPIVFTNVGDPVKAGLVVSLARPGGNATGLSSVQSDLSGKRLELLKESFPNIKRVAIFRNPDAGDVAFKTTEPVAGKLGLQLQSIEVRDGRDFDRAFETVVKGRAHALLPTPTPIVMLNKLESSSSRRRTFSQRCMPSPSLLNPERVV